LKKRSFILRSIGLVLFIGLFLYASPSQVFRALTTVDLPMLGMAAICALTVVVVKNIRWKYILALCGGSVRWIDLLPLAYISAFFGNITPGRFGDLWKISFAHSETFSRSQCLISFFYDRVLDACTMAILALVCIFTIRDLGDTAFVALLGLVVVGGFVAVFFRDSLSRVVEGVVGRYDVGTAGLGRSEQPVSFAVAAIALSHLAFVLVYFATYYFVFAAVGIWVPLSVLLLSGSVAAMAAILPITVSGLGTREAVLLYLLKPFYTSPSQVILAGLLWVFVLTYFLCGLVALPLWLLGLPRKPKAEGSETRVPC
jgi:uncharacterized membrane protein YbhN (UPF0104 family)